MVAMVRRYLANRFFSMWSEEYTDDLQKRSISRVYSRKARLHNIQQKDVKNSLLRYIKQGRKWNLFVLLIVLHTIPIFIRTKYQVTARDHYTYIQRGYGRLSKNSRRSPSIHIMSGRIKVLGFYKESQGPYIRNGDREEKARRKENP